MINKSWIERYVYMPFMFIASWLYMLTILQVFNVVANLRWLIEMWIKGELVSTFKEMKDISEKITNIGKVIDEFDAYEYQYDGILNIKSGIFSVFSMWPTWVPLTVVFIYRKKSGNCEDASMWAKWLVRKLKKNNEYFRTRVKSRLVIYTPYVLNKLNQVHWFTIIKFRGAGIFEDGKDICFSSGVITKESKDDLALRYLKNDSRYIWLMW